MDACPYGALEFSAGHMTVSELMDTIEKDRPYYERSGGGLTVSGGEPFFQPEFTRALLEEASERGIHTAVDTSLYTSWANIESVLPITDLWLVDLKLMDSERHKELTGVSNDPILKNLRALSAVEGASVIVRLPVVAGANADGQNFQEAADFVASLTDSPEVEVLPYHAMGLNKAAAIGNGGLVKEFEKPDAETLDTVKRVIQERGIALKNGQEE